MLRGNAFAGLLAGLLLISGMHVSSALAADINQRDNFDDGTLHSWEMGRPDITASRMTNIAGGGPGGDDDNYMRVTADGTAVAGGRLAFFNKVQWTGDFTAAGITSIAMDVRNFSSSGPLNIRLGINGGVPDPDNLGQFLGGLVATNASVGLSSDGEWTHVVFSLSPSSLTPVSGRSNITSNNIQQTLANVTELRLLSSASPAWAGDPVVATLGIDNISAVPLPPSALLFLSGLVGTALLRRRNSD